MPVPAHCDGCLYCLSLWWQQASKDETPPILVAHRLDIRTHLGHRGCRQHGERHALRDALSLRCHFDARSSRHTFTAGLYITYNDPNTSLNSPRYCTTRTSDIWVMSVPISRATAATGMHSGSGTWTPTSRPCSTTSVSRCSLRILLWKRFCSCESPLRSQRSFLLKSFPSSSNSACGRESLATTSCTGPGTGRHGRENIAQRERRAAAASFADPVDVDSPHPLSPSVPTRRHRQRRTMNRCKSRLTLNGSTLSTLTTCYWKSTIPGSQTLCGKIVFQGLTGAITA